jgi:hypothetical protein
MADSVSRSQLRPAAAKDLGQLSAGWRELIRTPRGGDHHVDDGISERSPHDPVVPQGADLALELEGHRQARTDETQRRVDTSGR